jgi:hypothetical protein
MASCKISFSSLLPFYLKRLPPLLSLIHRVLIRPWISHSSVHGLAGLIQLGLVGIGLQRSVVDGGGVELEAKK